MTDVAVLEHTVREELNRTAPRRLAVLRPIKVVLTNYPEGKTEELEAVNNPEDPSTGKRRIPFSRELFIENADFMADRHKREIHGVLERARQAPSLLESLEILFTAHCCENSPKVQSAFVVDLYAEASRNPQVADLVRDVLQTAMDGVTDLIARSPEAEGTTHAAGGSRSLRQHRWQFRQPLQHLWPKL